MTPNRRFELTDIPTDLSDAVQRQNFLSGINSALEYQEEQSSSAKSTGRMFAIGGAIIALLIATGLAFLVPGPQGPVGLQGEKGDEGPQGPAITNEQLQLAVNAAVGTRFAEFPKALTPAEIRELVPQTAPFNDSALRAEIEVLKAKIAEVEKTKVVAAPQVVVPQAEVAEAPQLTGQQVKGFNMAASELSSRFLGFDSKQKKGFKFPLFKNSSGNPTPFNPNLACPIELEPNGVWVPESYRLPNGVSVPAWAVKL